MGLARERPRADAARRRARVRRGDLRRDPRGLRAGARQHAVAAGARRVLPAGQRRRGGVRRRALRRAARPRGRRARPGCGRSCTSAACPRAAPPERAAPRVGRLDRGAAAQRSLPPTRIATTWRSGCTARDRPAGRKASCTCSTTRCTRALAYGRGVLGLGEDDVVFSPPKIFFAYGFGNSLTFPFAAGATTVLMPGRPEPEAVFATIERHRPTVLFGLPTLYVALAAHPGSERRDLSSLRLCVSAAETLSSELFDEWRRRYGLAIVEGLGSTEVLHIYLSNTPELQKPGLERPTRAGLRAASHRSRGPRRCAGRIRRTLGARPLAGAVLLEPSRQDRGDDARRLDLHRRPLPPRRRRLPLLRGPRRRPREGQRAMGPSARGRALPRRASRTCANARCSRSTTPIA